MRRTHRTLAGTLLAVTGCVCSPCCLPATLPLLLAVLGGTTFGGWLAAHEGAVGIGATLYSVGALGLGGFLLLHSQEATRRRNARRALDRPTRDVLPDSTSDSTPEPEPALCRLDQPCGCCAPHRVAETRQPSGRSIQPVLALRTEHEEAAVHKERR